MSKFRSLISIEIITVYIFFSIKEKTLRLRKGDHPINLAAGNIFVFGEHFKKKSHNYLRHILTSPNIYLP